MMQIEALVTNVGESGPFVRVALAAPEITPGLSPGRFVLADLGGYLRVPLFPAGLGAEGFEVLIPPAHPLAALRPGAGIDLVGPLGRGFEVDATTRRLLLVADMPHLPALLPLIPPVLGGVEGPVLSGVEGMARQGLAQGRSVALLLAASTASGLYPVRLLPPALEVHVVTADGSAGCEGSSLDLFPDLARWADRVCVAGDSASYTALAEIVREVRVGPAGRFAQALVVPPMACGVGACQGCAVRVARGVELACVDGPVFDLLELR